ncbi:MAG: hypothetical protein ACWA41_01790 [Putridiphycobacter sp.]
MKEFKKLSGVEAVEVHDTLGLYYKDVSGGLHDFRKNELVAKNIHNFKFADQELVFTEHELGDLFIVLNGEIKKVLHGYFYLAFFKRLPKHYAVVKNDSSEDLDNKVILLDQSFENQKAFKSFRANIDGYFVAAKRNDVVAFDENLQEIWTQDLKEIDESLSSDVKMSRIFYTANPNTFFIPLDSNQLLAIDISTGDLKWKRERLGRIAIFKDKIYCIADYTIKEVEAETGKIIREKSMQNLIDSYNFRPTGEHKVYDDYIFSMSTGKPGRVAIYDRKSLEFLELIEIDEMIPVGQNHLHWHDSKLYILDFAKTLHIFERE